MGATVLIILGDLANLNHHIAKKKPNWLHPVTTLNVILKCAQIFQDDIDRTII